MIAEEEEQKQEEEEVLNISTSELITDELKEEYEVSKNIEKYRRVETNYLVSLVITVDGRIRDLFSEVETKIFGGLEGEPKGLEQEIENKQKKIK